MSSIEITPPIVVGAQTFVRWHTDSGTYEDTAGVTVYSGADEPTEADAEDCIANPRTQPAEPTPRELSKLTLKRRLDDLNKWGAFKTLLEAAGAWDDFALAQVIRTDDPLFVAQAPTLKAALSLTDAQFDALLAP